MNTKHQSQLRDDSCQETDHVIKKSNNQEKETIKQRNCIVGNPNELISLNPSIWNETKNL